MGQHSWDFHHVIVGLMVDYRSNIELRFHLCTIRMQSMNAINKWEWQMRMMNANDDDECKWRMRLGDQWRFFFLNVACAVLRWLYIWRDFPSDKPFTFCLITTCNDSFCHYRSSLSHLDVWKHSYTYSMFLILCCIHIQHSHYAKVESQPKATAPFMRSHYRHIALAVHS